MIAVVSGSIAAVLALILILAGSALFWVSSEKTDDDGYYSTTAHTYTSPTRALVTESLDVSDLPDGLGDSDRLGRIRIDPTGQAGKATFVGIGPTQDVERYLDGVQHDEITDLDYDPFDLDTSRRAGEGRPAAPAAQPFWVATSTNGSTLEWKVREGEWSVVAMNSDGSPGVSVDAEVGAKVPLIRDLAWILALPGFVLALGAVLLALLGARGIARARQTASY
jgi:hypothetical protein